MIIFLKISDVLCVCGKKNSRLRRKTRTFPACGLRVTRVDRLHLSPVGLSFVVVVVVVVFFESDAGRRIDFDSSHRWHGVASPSALTASSQNIRAWLAIRSSIIFYGKKKIRWGRWGIKVNPSAVAAIHFDSFGLARNPGNEKNLKKKEAKICP